MLALILQAVQGANWQRSGSKGNPPQRIERPDDRPPSVRSGEELQQRRAAHDAELKRRRQAKQNKAQSN